jgi:hypothetical protein
MDGNSVPNLLWASCCKRLRPVSKAVFDVHPGTMRGRSVSEHFPPAQCGHYHCTGRGGCVSPAANPRTPASWELRLAVVTQSRDTFKSGLYTLMMQTHFKGMTVNPTGGQEFLPACLDKITAVRELISSTNHPIRPAVDGALAKETAGQSPQKRSKTCRQQAPPLRMLMACLRACTCTRCGDGRVKKYGITSSDLEFSQRARNSVNYSEYRPGSQLIMRASMVILRL